MSNFDQMSKAQLEEELTDAMKTLELLSPAEFYIDAREPYEERVEEIQQRLKQHEILDLIGVGNNSDDEDND